MTHLHVQSHAPHDDQATRLRRMMQAAPPVRAHQPTPAPTYAAPTIAIASGKGGVGKTSLAVNLTIALAKLNHRTTLLDGDLGLGNADLLCGLSPRAHLGHVLAGSHSVHDIALPIADRATLIPGASGLPELADLSEERHAELSRRLAPIDQSADAIVVDCGAGIGSGVLAFAEAADLLLVVTTPEPTAITDAYALIKSLAHRAARRHAATHSSNAGIRGNGASNGAGNGGGARLVVTQARSLDEAANVHRRLDAVSRKFLSHSLPLAGVIPLDPHVPQAVRDRTPFITANPSCRAAKGVSMLAKRASETLTLAKPSAARSSLVARFLRSLTPSTTAQHRG